MELGAAFKKPQAGASVAAAPHRRLRAAGDHKIGSSVGGGEIDLGPGDGRVWRTAAKPGAQRVLAAMSMATLWGHRVRSCLFLFCGSLCAKFSGVGSCRASWQWGFTNVVLSIRFRNIVVVLCTLVSSAIVFFPKISVEPAVSQRGYVFLLGTMCVSRLRCNRRRELSPHPISLSPLGVRCPMGCTRTRTR